MLDTAKARPQSYSLYDDDIELIKRTAKVYGVQRLSAALRIILAHYRQTGPAIVINLSQNGTNGASNLPEQIAPHVDQPA